MLDFGCSLLDLPRVRTRNRAQLPPQIWPRIEEDGLRQDAPDLWSADFDGLSRIEGIRCAEAPDGFDPDQNRPGAGQAHAGVRQGNVLV
jgi:hypothetical protein